MFGISQNSLDKIKSVLSTDKKLEHAVLYGSRAKGNFREGSDMDLTLKGNLNFDDLLKLSVALDNLNLPWKIDLSLYSQIRNKNLLEQ